jgi:hypothetical protein
MSLHSVQRCIPEFPPLDVLLSSSTSARPPTGRLTDPARTITAHRANRRFSERYHYLDPDAIATDAGGTEGDFLEAHCRL